MNSSVFDLDAVPGLNLAKQTARKVLEPGSGVHAVLLSGAHGGGAEDLAKFIAMGWACKKPDETGLPCGECQACKSTENEKCVDVQWIRPAGPSNLIRMEAIVERKGDGETIPITSFFRTQPLMARHKVAILAGADRMTSDATNAMLKTLEEPPSFAKLILTTDSIGKILPTILSRCLVVMCELPPSDLYQSLPDHERIFSEGNPGRLAQIQVAGTEYANLLSVFESAAKNGISGALGASEKARQVSEGLQDKLKMGARYAHCEVLKCLALWVVQNRQNHPESGRIIAESHRRILGNVNATLEYDALFATIFG